MDDSKWILENAGDLQVPIFFGALFVFALLEAQFPRRRGVAKRRLRWPANIGMTGLNVLALGLVPVSFITAASWAEADSIGLFHQGAVPAGLLVVGTLLARGFISTATHWINHAVPWLWRIHRVHHLDTELDVSTTVRFHPLEIFVGPIIGIPIVVALGLSPWVLAIYELLDVAVTLFSHSNLRVPKSIDRYARYVIVTPDLHRIHHSAWQPETDSNYGAVFPIWDLIFGTFRAEPRDSHETMTLGLTEVRDSSAHHLGFLLASPFSKRLGPAKRQLHSAVGAA